MKIELGLTGLYQRYLEKYEQLPLYYCHRCFQYNHIGGGVNFLKTVDKGFYRCEETENGNIKVYDTYVGITLQKDNFDYFFKKPNKLRLFLYKHHLWA